MLYDRWMVAKTHVVERNFELEYASTMIRERQRTEGIFAFCAKGLSAHQKTGIYL